MNPILLTCILGAGTFILTAAILRSLIPVLKRRKVGQIILEIGPSWHMTKQGTPTMGGIAPIVAIVLCFVIFLVLFPDFKRESRLSLLAILVYATLNAAIGLIDDVTKLLHKENKGLTPTQKMIWQSLAAILFLFCISQLNDKIHIVSIPFTSLKWDMGIWFYFFSFICLVWFVNCANLTDGIDGLATSVAGGIGIFYFLSGCLSLQVPLLMCGAALTGGGAGFYVYNRYPAKVFMGDTGSLFFGALGVCCAFLLSSPLLFLLVGIPYTLEGLSVLLQVVYFKLTNGKRLFKMAPLHHHMEKCGWKETQITMLFFLLTLLFSCVALPGGV